MTINELITKAHQNAKEKGFWDTERNTGELLMLIVSECGEALEAHRKGRFCPDGPRRVKLELDFPPSMVANFPGPDPGIKELYEEHIKGSFEEELADIVIRIADFMGSQLWKFNGALTIAGPIANSFGFNVGEDLLGCVRVLCQHATGESLQANLSSAVRHVFAIAESRSIDLWRHIELKMAYNSSREYLHGKKY